jgi:hypothetical protein
MTACPAVEGSSLVIGSCQDWGSPFDEDGQDDDQTDDGGDGAGGAADQGADAEGEQAEHRKVETGADDRPQRAGVGEVGLQALGA